ncbi:unnamed protein product [Bursaphelenchus xylophilus]|uniref:(pine wood nematode) hypothetical protein n=1 Tax=Bursaphelenchus xylophilus TaxID=6326 RepID=A0A1I7SCA0_BURXY|nr:unnamed protein product [Bursaphelenchus xylophilus]CAG9094491.1 unnamed protein product [Bursaphelenchus xylophilus]
MDKRFLRRLVVDTTEATSFVLDKRFFGDRTTDNNTFNPTKSSSFSRTGGFTTIYDLQGPHKDSVVSGDLGIDNVLVGRYTIRPEFGVAQAAESSDSALKDFDGQYVAGRIGFARGDNPLTNFRVQLLNRFKTSSICLAVFQDGKGSFTPTVSLGAPRIPPADLITSFKADNDKDGLWRIPLNSISIGNFSATVNARAIFSSALDEIVVPFNLLPRIAAALKAKYNKNSSCIVVDCQNEVPLKLNINGTEIVIPAEDYSKKVDGVCYLKITRFNSPYYILGANILTKRGICLDFEKETVTLYKANRGALEGTITL